MKERLKLRSVIQLLPFASLVVTAVEVIFGQLRRLLKGVEKLPVMRKESIFHTNTTFIVH